MSNITDRTRRHMDDLHCLKVTEVDEDGYPDVVYLTHCPGTDDCAIWHECKECESPLTDELDDDEYFDLADELQMDGVVRHGLLHKALDDGWFSRDDPHNCAARWIQDWDWPADMRPGDYTFDLDYLGDGEWISLSIRRVREAG